MWLRQWLLAKCLLMVTANPAVIPPPWADPVRNPCASRSWQLLHWPADGLCYRIFERGPCPDTMELAFNRGSAGPLCRCPPGTAQWARDGKCYALFSRGPCSSTNYFAPVPVRNRIRRSTLKEEEEEEEGSGVAQEETKNSTREDKGRSFELLFTLPSITRGPWGTCREIEQCPFDHIFWPRDGRCYLRLTRGPCPKGDLLTSDPVSGEARCACDEGKELGRYYWPTTRSCYEHFTRGPCEKGALFLPNSKTNKSQCTCHKRLPNYHSSTGLCFPLGTDDPCQPGHWFVYDPIKRVAQCRCKPEHALWPEDGSCYRLYTRGPCPPGYFLTSNLTKSDLGPAQCTRNPCRRSHLYFPEEDPPCHRVATQGPCPLGELVVYEAYRGVSYRGRCGCSPDFAHHYWRATGRCYELGTRGPCTTDRVFVYDKHKARAECSCDRSAGLVEWRDKCYHLYTRGPCTWNEWLVPDKEGVKCDCKPGFKFEPVMRTCLPPSVTLVQFLAELAQQRLLSAATG